MEELDGAPIPEDTVALLIEDGARFRSGPSAESPDADGNGGNYLGTLRTENESGLLIPLNLEDTNDAATVTGSNGYKYFCTTEGRWAKFMEGANKNDLLDNGFFGWDNTNPKLDPFSSAATCIVYKYTDDTDGTIDYLNPAEIQALLLDGQLAILPPDSDPK